MSDITEQIKNLQARLDKMVVYQDYFYREINLIREEIKKLNVSQGQPIDSAAPPVSREFSWPEKISGVSSSPENQPVTGQITIEQPTDSQAKTPVAGSGQTGYFKNAQSSGQREKNTDEQNNRNDSKEPQKHHALPRKSGAEEFVGRNLISLIGIIITIIGIGIGAKYAIDRDLISPGTRIVAGYLFAFTTLGIAVWLKPKYLNFSAVLLSGAMAMMYFLTFFAYGFYGLMPQTAAFLMMLLITAATVGAAINYSRQVIAHIGLVGAYAVPFLLSDGSGQISVLFGYMTIVNFGILIVSVKKFWKPLYYSSFIFTWLIFAGWYFTAYNPELFFTLAFTFLSIFFLTFYLTFVSYKLIADEEFNTEIVFLILINSFIFYGFGYLILNSQDSARQYSGLFALLNAFLHFFFALVVARYKLGGKINLYLPVGLALTFLTIAFPVQFGGHWLTLLWVAEALFLFTFGRFKRLAILEIFSYPVIFLACLALVNDWERALASADVATPFLNVEFLTSLLFAGGFAVMLYVNRQEREPAYANRDLSALINFVIPTIFLIVLYNTFRVEIGNFFAGRLVRTGVSLPAYSTGDPDSVFKDSSLQYLNVIWQINYTMLFLSLLSLVNIKKFKSPVLGFINVGLNALVIFVFLTLGLYLIGELRETYLAQTNAEYFERGIFHLVIRYITYIFAGGLIFVNYQYFRQKFLRDAILSLSFDFLFDTGFYFTLLWVLSSELLNLASIFGLSNSSKLGLSILWGVYALALIVLGIYRKKAYLRIGAIILFALTLVKLFFYDIADLDTISKTIVFVILGILLLIISFLYNKFKDSLFGEAEAESRI